jgi:hypothetical protein
VTDKKRQKTKRLPHLFGPIQTVQGRVASLCRQPPVVRLDKTHPKHFPFTSHSRLEVNHPTLESIYGHSLSRRKPIAGSYKSIFKHQSYLNE